MRNLLVVLSIIASVAVQAQTFQRGDVVRLRPEKESQPETRLDLVVVAVPKDTVRAENKTILVNGKPVTGFSADFLAAMAISPKDLPVTLPDDHYFVMGERRISNSLTQYRGLHPAGRLERVK
jgi:hypothetical protein